MSLSETFALDAVGVDGVERAQVDVARFGGFGQGGDALAQVVQRHGDAFGVEFAGDGQGLIERFTGDEPGGEPLREGRGFHPSAQPFQARQEEEEAAHDDRLTSVHKEGHLFPLVLWHLLDFRQ